MLRDRRISYRLAGVALAGGLATLVGHLVPSIAVTAQVAAPKKSLPTRDLSPRPEDPCRMSVRVTTPKQEYRPLEPIEIEIIMTNTSPKSEMVQMFIDRALYGTTEIAVTDGLGREVPKTRYLARGLINGTSNGIPPGGDWRPKLLANLVNDMTAQDDYKIVVKVEYWSNANAGAFRRVESEPITVKVRGEPYTGRPDPPESTNPDNPADVFP